MHQGYTIQQAPDLTWSVLAQGSETPVRLAGIPQSGLSRLKAEVVADVLQNALPRRQRVMAAAD